MKRKFEHIFRVGYKTIVRYQDENFKSHFEEVEIPYELFVETPEETGYKYFLNENINLKKLTFKNSKEYQDFEKTYGGLSNYKTYGKRNGIYSYIFENFFEKSESPNPKILFLDIETTSDSGFPYPEHADHPISLFQFFDSFEKKYFCFYTSDANLDKEYIQSKFEEEIKFKKFSSEENMLLGFAQSIKNLNPLIITGWNIKGFDIPYIINRFKKLGLDPAVLSPFGSVKNVMKEYSGQTTFDCEISGFVVLDMLDTYKKFVHEPRESYSLNNIARVELGDSKVSYGEFENLTDLYKKNFNKFVEYGIQDVKLIVDIEAKKSIISIQRTIAEMMGVTLEDALGTVKPWGTFTYNKAIQRGLVLPNDAVNASNDTIKGGWVMTPTAGKYKWVCTVDWNSLYPNTIVSANLSPDVKISLNELSKKYPDIIKIVRQYFSEDEEKVLAIPEDVLNYIRKICEAENISFSALGIPFSNEKQGLLSTLMENMYKQRKIEKKKSQNFKKEYERLKKEGGTEEQLTYNKTEYMRFYLLEQAIKIAMNSGYGAFANKHFVLFDNEIAASITANGRYLNRFMSSYVNEKCKKFHPTYEKKEFLLYGDTDSAMFVFEPIVNSWIERVGPKTDDEITTFLDKFIKTKIQPMIDESIGIFAKRFNIQKPEVLVCEREKICSAFLITGKKTYICDVLDNEGVRYAKPERVMKGITIVKTSTPPFVRREVVKSLDIFLYGDNTQLLSWLKDIKKEFFKASPKEISRISGVNSFDYDLSTGYSERTNKNGMKLPIPINSRAAMSHNEFIEKNNLQSKFRAITLDDKLHYLYLKEPNKLNYSVMGFLDESIFEYLPKDIIDYEKNWKMNFIPNIEILTKPLFWKIEKVESLEDF